MKDSFRRFYWKHDWFRRLLNHLRASAFSMTITFVGGIIIGSNITRTDMLEVQSVVADAYKEANERASECNEKLRLRIHEHKGCEAKLREIQK